MDLEQRANALEHAELFRSLDRDSLLALGELATVQHLRAGELPYREGNLAATWCYLRRTFDA